MKNTQISIQYQPTVLNYCGFKGVPAEVVHSKVDWIDEPGIVRTRTPYLRFYVGPVLIAVDLALLCSENGMPYTYVGRSKDNEVLTISQDCVPVIADYCEQHQYDYDSVMSKIKVVDEPIEVPLSVEKTHVSVRSNKVGKVYDILYVPKLLKYLKDPSYGTWMYVSEQYKETIEVTASALYLDIEFIKRHIRWITDEEDVFVLMYTSRVALYLDGTYRYLNVARFRRIALGEEPVNYDEW